MRMRNHPVGLVVWFLVRPFVYFHTLCLQTAKALAGLRGLPEPSLVAFKYNNLMSWLKSIFQDDRLVKIWYEDRKSKISNWTF